MGRCLTRGCRCPESPFDRLPTHKSCIEIDQQLRDLRVPRCTASKTSAWGHQRTSRPHNRTSALPQKADASRTSVQMVPFFARLPSCLVGMEACGTSHYWARELIKLGHQVRLMPPAYVKPYVKRGKTDAADAEAICEAVARPTMRFVPSRTASVAVDASDTRSADQAAHAVGQHDPRPARRVWHRHPEGASSGRC